ncbi:hypothetical protein K3495_g14042 [Podosphaera aphanis]|nr:hypothetical protein K3495_g14042 [Podosphaera aphanis]
MQFSAAILFALASVQMIQARPAAHGQLSQISSSTVAGSASLSDSVYKRGVTVSRSTGQGVKVARRFFDGLANKFAEETKEEIDEKKEDIAEFNSKVDAGKDALKSKAAAEVEEKKEDIKNFSDKVEKGTDKLADKVIEEINDK